MRRALELAERGRGLTSPNPLVGAVVVRERRVVGEGSHVRAGGPHAEIEALAAAGDARARRHALRDARAVRAPRADAALRARRRSRPGVAPRRGRAGDPNPLVAGGGIAAAARGRHRGRGRASSPRRPSAQNRAFLTAMRERRPHVTLKAAATLDGKIADVHGASQWITGEAARAHAHRLRSEVGRDRRRHRRPSLRDDPALPCGWAEPWPREPYRVVLDTQRPHAGRRPR